MLAQGEALVANIVDVKVPDIGDYKDVPIIEILVKPGDVVKADASLVTLESDKATMDVPAPKAGHGARNLAKIGDKVAMGSLILRLEEAGGDAAPAPNGRGAGRRSGRAGRAARACACAVRSRRRRRRSAARPSPIFPASTPDRRFAVWRANSISI